MLPKAASGQTRSWGHVGSMSGLPESGQGWAIYELRRMSNGGSLFDPELSTPEQIARAYREAWRTTPSKLEKLIRALRAEYTEPASRICTGR